MNLRINFCLLKLILFSGPKIEPLVRMNSAQLNHNSNDNDFFPMVAKWVP